MDIRASEYLLPVSTSSTTFEHKNVGFQSATKTTNNLFLYPQDPEFAVLVSRRNYASRSVEHLQVLLLTFPRPGTFLVASARHLEW